MINSREIFAGNFGLEKENLRVDRTGKLALTVRPNAFAMDNQYITTDFSESQVEMITPPCKTIDAMYDFITNLHTIVSENIGDELLWPQSNPPILPEEAKIPLAVFGEEAKDTYREYLAEKYGRKRAVLSGIHFNFSFSDAYLQMLYNATDKVVSEQDFVNSHYLKITKYLLKYRWLFIHLFGASPIFHETYMPICVAKSTQSEAGNCQIEHMQSLRNSCCGYRNDTTFSIDYSSLPAYNKTVEQLIAEHKIKMPAELYTAVRLKQNATATKINYIELRFLDLNPLNPIGIAKGDLELLHLFILYFASLPDFTFDTSAQILANTNQDYVAQPENPTVSIQGADGEMRPLAECAHALLTALAEYCDTLPTDQYDVVALLSDARNKVDNPSATYSSQIKEQIMATDYIAFHLQRAVEYQVAHAHKAYTLAGYEDMELSTQILMRAALKKGLTIEVLDRATQFIRLSTPDGKHVEYIKEATKTSLDKYSQVLLMENKHVTKRVLAEHHIATPAGYVIESIAEGMELFAAGKLPKGLVVKPNNTNFGIGITIFTEGYTAQQFEDALAFALAEDTTVLLETFVTGKEYRFLVMDGAVKGILHRRAANVVGDGTATIAELVAVKNQNPLRGKGYVTPLEILQLGTIEIAFLAQQALSPTSIIPEGVRVYLRENSNISTGGDSIDMTDAVHSSYHDVAVAAVKALDVAISGVDMLIHAIDQPAAETNHAIIELNFNPAIHIHCFPFIGENRHVGETVIDLLFPAKE